MAPTWAVPGLFTILTAEMVHDLNTHHKKPELELHASNLLDNFSDNLDNFSDYPTNLFNNPTGITSPPLFYTKRPNILRMTRFKLFPNSQQFSQPKYNYRSSLPSSSAQHRTLSNYSTANTTQNDNLVTPYDNLVDNTPVKYDTDSPIKVYFKTNYPLTPPSFYHPTHFAYKSNIKRLPAKFNSLHLHYSSKLRLNLFQLLKSQFIIHPTQH